MEFTLLKPLQLFLSNYHDELQNTKAELLLSDFRFWIYACKLMSRLVQKFIEHYTSTNEQVPIYLQSLLLEKFIGKGKTAWFSKWKIQGRAH